MLCNKPIRLPAVVRWPGTAAVALGLLGCHSGPDASRVDTTPYQSVFGPNVMVFDDTMDQADIQHTLDTLHRQQKQDEFSSNRYALLFKPGEYNLDVTVDYYVQALGLGLTPGQVKIKGAVQSIASTEGNKVTTMFWRGAENFRVEYNRSSPMLWAVSQAAPYRRMHIEGSINFDKGSWASGGVLANSIVDERAGLTTGQQWFVRNSRLGRWEGGNWNRVFVGVEGAPPDQWPQKPTTVIDQAPVIREKPFLAVDEAGDYGVFVPELRRNARGVSWADGDESGEWLPLERFYIARADRDSVASINRALKEGKHLLLTPGIYPLDRPIEVDRANTVVLGLGLPTLVPQSGEPALVTADVSGLKLAGFMTDAGPERSPVLIRVGESGAAADHSANPSSLHDIYCRVGGAIAGKARVCLTLNSHDVIGDHFWLWRADHGVGAQWSVNEARHGLVVNGDDVTLYGLFNEHFQHYQTLWDGERGRTYFYQSEIPYSPPSTEAWNDEGKPGYASYKVADHVREHRAWGLGIYSFFRGESTVANNVRLENAMEVPNAPGIAITHIANFAGLNGGINHVINGLGASTEVGELTLFDGFEGGQTP